MPAAEERALLERAKQSAAGFGELFDATYDRIYAYAYRRVGTRAAAEDIAASVFEDALRGIRRVRWQGKPALAWLYRIAARRVADYYRKAHGEIALDSDAASEDDVDGVEREEEQVSVRRALAELNESDREVIRLAFFEELDGKGIAATLNCTTNTAYVRLHRALKRLETVLRDEDARQEFIR